METNVLASYEINEDTVAIIPANHYDYASIVLEGNETYYVKKKVFQLIEEGCLEGGAKFEGRRESVIHKTGSDMKVPIPINPNENIYAFPTNSPSSHDCMWIFYFHVKEVKPNGNNKAQTMITFNNSEKLLVDVSYQIIKKQMLRTSYCILRFSPRFCDSRRFG
jgi:competence protein ComK